MKLSANFWLSEFTRSQTADRFDIKNIPDEGAIDNLQNLCINVLQSIRYEFELPVHINSGYRCLELNRKLGSKDTSAHILGFASDIEIASVDNYKLAQWIEDKLDYDQLILEMYKPSEGPNSGWVHVSYKSKEENRKQSLTIFKGGETVVGLQENE